MKTKILLTVLALMAALGSQASEKFVVGGITYMLLSSEIYVTAPDEGHYEGDIVIPEKITYNKQVYSVKGISGYAFCNDQKVTSVTIPKTIESIGTQAFLGCYGIKELTIPENVTTIESDAFGACSFTSLTIKCTLKSYQNVFTRMKTSSIIYTKESEISKIKRSYVGEVHEIGFIRNPVIEGVSYLLNDVKNTATVVNNGNLYSGQIIVPETIESQGISYKVTAIGSRAFAECHQLQSVILPNTVTEIGTYAFSGSSSLQSVTLPNNLKKIDIGTFSGCTAIYPFTIPSSVNEIASLAFASCSKLTTIKIPASVSVIGEKAFYDCINLRAFEIEPESYYFSTTDGTLYNKSQDELIIAPAGKHGSFAVADKTKRIANSAFEGCAYITEISMPNSVTDIGSRAFSGCSRLSDIHLSLRLKTLGAGAFLYCTSLKKIVIPRQLEKTGGDIFGGCKLDLVVILCPTGGTTQPLSEGINAWEFNAETLDTNAVIYAMEPQYFSHSYQLAQPTSAEQITPYLRGVDFEVHPTNDANLTILEIGSKRQQLNTKGEYYVDGLDISETYDIIGHYSLAHHDFTYDDLVGEFTTKTPTVTLQELSSTQKTIRVKVTSSNDKTCSAEEEGITFGYPEQKVMQRDGGVIINNLSANSGYSLLPYARYGEKTVTGRWSSISTKGMNPNITVIKATPTTIYCKGTYQEIDETVVSCRFSGYEAGSKELLMKGLTPGASYSLVFEVTTGSGSTQSVTRNVITPDLKLESLTPKVTNKGEVIVCAQTNIADEELNVGFEWRKVDAPDVVPSKSGKGAVYNGTMEGIIKSLDVTSYYKVRPFYESSAGKKYYGEWIGFDPSDFSYFEPTVHTYADAAVSRGTAILTGYVLQGSDDILEQGFEYWQKGYSSVRGVASSVMTIQSTGQRMQAQLTELTDGAIYGYRAYVKTIRGTAYGEEMEFTMPIISGILPTYSSKEKVIIRIITTNGQIVRTYEQEAGEDSKIDTSGLPHGIYLICTSSRNKQQTRKVTIK